jgi:Fe-S cluster assembly ATP-binding protein
MLFEIKNLFVNVNGKNVLKGVNLSITKGGRIHALLGPNASGKSTLVHTISGFPKYKVTKGSIIFEGENITKKKPEEKVKLGIAIAFQHPPAIKGVTLEKLLQKISGKANDIISRFEITEVKTLAEKLLKREVNVNLSGGEKKISEILQVLSLNPKLAILDEIDSGLDIKLTKKIAEIIKNERKKNKTSFLIITHRGSILRFLKPDLTHVMIDGKIICSSTNWKKIWKLIEAEGYEKCRKCKLAIH